MIKPIPKRLLPSEVSYKEYIPDTGRGATYKDIVTLYNVKIEEKKVFTKTNDGNEIIGNASLIYDYVNSKGLMDIPINQSIVIYNSREYHVIDAETLRGNSDNPHHYEIVLK